MFGLIVALVDVTALYWLDVSLPWLWGLLSFITNYIPNIGFVLAWSRRPCWRCCRAGYGRRCSWSLPTR